MKRSPMNEASKIIRRLADGPPMTTGELLVAWRRLIEFGDSVGVQVLLYAPDRTELDVPRPPAFSKNPACPACAANRFHTAPEFDANHPEAGCS